MSPGFSPDRRWWWTGSTWVAATTPDGRWSWNGRSWVRSRPRWSRWTTPIGIGLLGVAFIGLFCAGVSTMGDPGPGHVVEPNPSWVGPASAVAVALLAVGLLLLFAAEIFRRVATHRGPRPSPLPPVGVNKQ
ncbi:MAG TPA: hypothetical protein VKB59_19230 [Micromonosporaceae bacterium]|nr:hypothetical protein [Micromonosporaceae bacterium]